MLRMNLLWRMVYVAHGHGHMLHNRPLEVGYVTYGQHHTWHNPPRGGLCDLCHVWPFHTWHKSYTHLEVGYVIYVTYGRAIRDISHITPTSRGGSCDVWPCHTLHNPQVFIFMSHAWIYFAAFLVRDKPWKKWKMNKYIPLLRANISIRNKYKQMQCMSRLWDFMRDKHRLFCHSCPMRHIPHVTNLLFSCSE